MCLRQTLRLVAVGVDIGEPGNAGTLIRIADAMGAAAVVFLGHSVDPYNGKCLRASAGSIFAIPVVVAPDVDAAIAALRDAGLRVLATTVDGELSLDDADLSAPTAWLFGSEAHGLSAEIAELADARVSIAMSGSAQSLNVAAAAAICLYQSARAQRAGLQARQLCRARLLCRGPAPDAARPARTSCASANPRAR